MNDVPINFSFAGLPAGYCFSDPARFALDIVAGLSGFVPGQVSSFIIGSSEPDVNDRNKLWVRLNPDGSPDRQYIFFAGKWVSKNAVEANAQERRWWVGTEAQAWAYDGGSGQDPASTTPTATTGAMWQRDTDYDAKFPFQAGTITEPDNTTKTFNVGDVGGEENHALILTETPPHNHQLWVGGSDDSTSAPIREAVETIKSHTNGADATYMNANGGSNYVQNSGGDPAASPPVVALPHNNMPPFRVGMWIKRTARVYYTAI